MSDLFVVKKSRVFCAILLNPLIVLFLAKGVLVFLGINHNNYAVAIIPALMSVLAVGVYIGVFAANQKFKGK